jgi:hypothetical protein
MYYLPSRARRLKIGGLAKGSNWHSMEDDTEHEGVARNGVWSTQITPLTTERICPTKVHGK